MLLKEHKFDKRCAKQNKTKRKIKTHCKKSTNNVRNVRFVNLLTTIKAGFHKRESHSQSCNQMHRVIWSSKNKSEAYDFNAYDDDDNDNDNKNNNNNNNNNN